MSITKSIGMGHGVTDGINLVCEGTKLGLYWYYDSTSEEGIESPEVISSVTCSVFFFPLTFWVSGEATWISDFLVVDGS